MLRALFGKEYGPRFILSAVQMRQKGWGKMAGTKRAFLSYAYDGVTCHIDKGLMETWMDREELKKGTRQFYEAMACIMVNAQGRLKLEGIPVAGEALGKPAEELIREEIELTGGHA